MITIKSVGFKHKHLDVLYNWFCAEWGEVDAFENAKHGMPLPAPLLAVEDGNLLGGLSFTRYNSPQNDTMALWVNAVFVDPKQRGKQVAYKLVKAANIEAFKLCEPALFARTDVPDLYKKSGWKLLKPQQENFIMHFEF